MACPDLSKAKAVIAMRVAQDSDRPLLDEPTAKLAIDNQIEMLSLVRKLSHEKDLRVSIVLHDINLACCFCDRTRAP